MVVLHHCMLVSPTLATAYQQGEATRRWAWWLTNTPLHLVWEGSEAVVVFFVLSGFVLSLPFLGTAARPTWWRYYPQRLVRLYVPVAAALLLAAATYVAVDHRVQPGVSWWIASHALEPSPGLLAHDLPLVFKASNLDSVLWSLRWELAFSLLLPFFVLVVNRAGARTRGLLAVAMIALVATTGLVGIFAGRYLPMFGLGVVMAAERERLHAYAARLGAAGWAAVLVSSLLLLYADWIPAIGRSVASWGLTTVGAGVLIVAALECPSFRAGLDTRFLQGVGRRSFSLYLVHEPIVVSLALLLRTTNPALMMAVSVPTALVVAAVFFVLVEKPSVRAARQLGRIVEEKVRAVRVRPAEQPRHLLS